MSQPIEQAAMNANNGSGAYQQQGYPTADGQPVFTPAQPEVQIDTSDLLKIQGRFINAQTRYMMSTAQPGTPEYVDVLAAYSRAQMELISVQQNVLHQCGII
jgi:hypothetical protein